jgi:hypothetical protein
MITIRRCQTSDVPEVLAFLDAYWKAGHILTVERSLFDWQYSLRDHPGEYSIAIARRDADGALLGLLGYMPTRQFDPALSANNSIWLALWKIRADVATGALGLRLLSYVTETEPHTSVGVVGFQPAVGAIYKALKFQVGELQQYVLPNPDVSNFEVASFERPPFRPVNDAGLTALPVDDLNFARTVAGLELGTRDRQIPKKTPEYFRGRYLQHPMYRYLTFVLHRGNRPIGMLATRVAIHGGRQVLRLVDFVGPDDAVPGLGILMLAQIRALGAEYADVHNWGIDPALFEAAGFSRVDPAGTDIVPNHFEPFERRHAPIRFALKTDRPAVLFKGDGDQDRPNQRAAS